MGKKERFSFIHCADLHLDSPFQGVHALDPEVASLLRDATFKSFTNVVDLAIREQVAFLIVAGDVYDGADRSLRAQLLFRQELQRASDAGISSFVAHGNHDPLSGWEAGLAMPKGVVRFTGDVVQRHIATHDGHELAQLYGISYGIREVRENLSQLFTKDSSPLFTIGVLHCNLGGDPNHGAYAPCTADDLAKCGTDYWALGHVHNRKVVRDSSPCIAYPGNTQGRSVVESGARGCYLVHVFEDGDIEPEFVATDVVRWFLERVDIGELATIDDLLEALDGVKQDVRSRAEGRAAIVRLCLTGRSELHETLRRIDPEKDLALPLRESEKDRPDFVLAESVQVSTRPPVDIAKRRAVKDFIGEFLGAAESVRSSPAPSSSIRSLLSTNPEHRVVRSVLDQLSDAELISILDEAEALGLDELVGEEG